MENNYIKVSEASKILGISATKFYTKYIHGDLIETHKDGVTKVLKDDVEQIKYKIDNPSTLTESEVYNDADEVFKVLSSYPLTRNMINPYRYARKPYYLVSNKGRIINSKRMRQIKPCVTGNGHLQVSLFYPCIQPEVHDLVAYLFCDNALNKQKVHHIDGDKKNNNADNLIFVTDEQHKAAHRMNLKCKEYQDFIDEIKSENKYKKNNMLRVIPHLDYPSDNKCSSFMYATEDSYQKYLSSGDESQLEIVGERFVCQKLK